VFSKAEAKAAYADLQEKYEDILKDAEKIKKNKTKTTTALVASAVAATALNPILGGPAIAAAIAGREVSKERKLGFGYKKHKYSRPAKRVLLDLSKKKFDEVEPR